MWCFSSRREEEGECVRKDAARTRVQRPDSHEDSGINFSHQTRLFPINLHGLMEGWKGRGNEEEEGEEAIILIITVDTFLHQKEVEVHIKRAPGSFHDNYPFCHWLMGLRPERVLSEEREKREEEEREWALDGGMGKAKEESMLGLGLWLIWTNKNTQMPVNWAVMYMSDLFLSIPKAYIEAIHHKSHMLQWFPHSLEL